MSLPLGKRKSLPPLGNKLQEKFLFAPGDNKSAGLSRGLGEGVMCKAERCILSPWGHEVVQVPCGFLPQSYFSLHFFGQSIYTKKRGHSDRTS